MKTDPVCGMEVQEIESPATCEYDGVTYFFCSNACRGAFEDNPRQWIIEAGLDRAA
jgi:YHS domain-containing protein